MKQEDEDFGAMLAEFEKQRPARGRSTVKVGDLVRGRVMTVGREAVFVTLSDGKTEGMLALDELRDQRGDVSVKEEDELEARVAALGDKADQVVLRKLVRKGPEARAELEQAWKLGIPVEGTISAVNKGGVDVNVAGVRAFCPISQLELRPVADASIYVGRTLQFRVTKYEEDRRGANLIVSRRALLEEEQRTRAVETRAKLVVGAVLPGTVSAIKDFGAFVDLGGIEGMLPASELSFVRGVRPEEVLAIGQPVQVKILRIERTDDPRRPEKLSLSLKALEQDPWDAVAERFRPGTKVAGKVMRLESFGAFVELSPGIEGLVHIGELSGGKQVRHAKDLAKAGDQLEVTVLSVDRERRRISLGVGEHHDIVDPTDLAAAGTAKPGRLGTFADLLAGLKR
jgi:small subunit ribosomal protein S1